MQNINNFNKILFNIANYPRTKEDIYLEIENFDYKDTSKEIIEASKHLDKEGGIFVSCADKILVDFGMTRSGVFHDKAERLETLKKCWVEVGDEILEIRRTIPYVGSSRDRYLLELTDLKQKKLIDEIWQINKKLLPLTMGEHSFGLVGASKILFSILPEIVLPVDNGMWLKVFKTVDLGDVIRRMAEEIQLWEKATGERLNEIGSSYGLTTLPSVYNVMAMAARPRKEAIFLRRTKGAK